jgi:hypothetical protein
MRNLIASLIILTLINSVFSQENNVSNIFERNTIYTEAFGQGFCWSLNYDRLFNTEKRIMNSYTAGIVYVPESIQFGDGTYYGIPLSYNWLIGKKSHHFELGIGLTSLLVNPNSTVRSDFYSYFTPKIGYRFQRQQGGLFFRATATPMIALLNVNTHKFGSDKSRSFSTLSNVAGLDYVAFPWPGLSIGYSFK